MVTIEKDQNGLLITELEQVKAKLANYWAREEGNWTHEKKDFLEFEEFIDLLGSLSTALFEYNFKGVT